MKKLAIGILACCLGACSKPNHHQAQGYIEGRYTYIASSVSGVLKNLAVERGAIVHEGDLLFELDPQPESDLYQQALENLKQLTAARDARVATLEFAKITYQRYQTLIKQGAVQQAQLDNAKSTFDAATADLAGANASIASAQALVKRAEWTNAEKKKLTPIPGIVFDTYYRLGEYTEANKPILSLLAPADIRAVFYIPEPDLALIKLGGLIEIEGENLKQNLRGRIKFISPSAEYTPPVIYSNDTNYKFIYRIEAEFDSAIAMTLHPGQPITVNYQVN